MSIIGILSSNLFSGGAAQNTLQTQGAQKNTPKFEQIKTEFQQLGQDLQSGNLTQAQTDYAALAADFPGASQLNAAASTTTAGSTAGPTTGTGTVAQQFAQLGQDLKAGNLQAAQQDFTNIQQTTEQTAQQNGAQQAGGHHHHHRHGGGTQSASSTSSSQQSIAINQAFQHALAGFDGWESLWGAVGIYDFAKRSSTDRGIHLLRIEPHEHGIEFRNRRQPECECLKFFRVAAKGMANLNRPCALR